MYVYKYSVDIYLLCMIKVRIRWCTCSLGECYNLDRSVVVVLSPPPPLYFVFENSNLLTYIQKIQGMSSLAL